MTDTPGKTQDDLFRDAATEWAQHHAQEEMLKEQVVQLQNNLMKLQKAKADLETKLATFVGRNQSIRIVRLSPTNAPHGFCVLVQYKEAGARNTATVTLEKLV